MYQEKVNTWLKNAHPYLEGFEIRAQSDCLFYTVCAPEEAGELMEPLRGGNAPEGFLYVIARKKVNGVFANDVVLLMPKSVIE